MSIGGATTRDAERFDEIARVYDALLVLSFGGPEGHDDVAPFLANVAGSHGIPAARLAAVADHYHHFGGKSPLNAQNRALIAALEAEFRARGPALPVYFGNRNWHPYVTDTVRKMAEDGVRRALVFVTSVFSSYSGCRQYREDVQRACEAVGPGAPRFDKLRVFYNHPGFIGAMADRVREARERFPPHGRADAHLVFTAHSIPTALADRCDYVAQLEEACRLVAEGAGHGAHRLVYQSRSGPPHMPWLEPDILPTLEGIRAAGAERVVVAPIGFMSDHMEVIWDLDTDARRLADRIGLRMERAGTVGTHPDFVAMIRELVVERMTDHPQRRFLGARGPSHDICPRDCCPKGERPASSR